jgi:hypothetical protein
MTPAPPSVANPRSERSVRSVHQRQRPCDGKDHRGGERCREAFAQQQDREQPDQDGLRDPQQDGRAGRDRGQPDPAGGVGQAGIQHTQACRAPQLLGPSDRRCPADPGRRDQEHAAGGELQRKAVLS